MHVEGKQTVQVIAAPCKSNPISSKYERSQRADNSDLCRKIQDESRCSIREDLFLPSMGAINAKEVPKTSSETENSGGKCDTSTSESNVIQQPEHVSWKNPQSVPISNHMDYEKSTHTLGCYKSLFNKNIARSINSCVKQMYQATKRVLSLFGRKVAAGVDTANNFAEFAFFGAFEMSVEPNVVCSCLLYEFLKPGTKACRHKICIALQSDVVTNRTAQSTTVQKVSLGQESLEDEPRSGKPCVKNVLKENRSQDDRAEESILFSCREYLATYQESCGTPRTEYSFAALIIIMAQATVRSLLALIYMLANIGPIIQMFSFILRFVLDKIIDIHRTENVQQVTVKLTIFLVQLFSVYICLIFILGFIVLPIIQMANTIATKFITMCN